MVAIATFSSVVDSSCLIVISSERCELEEALVILYALVLSASRFRFNTYSLAFLRIVES